jgi:membrane protease YdiL (CAAX protease family)
LTRVAKAAALAAAPTAVLLTLNGFYLGAAYRASPALFWLLDALQFAVVPAASLWALARFAGVRPPDYGLGSLVGPHGALAALPVYVLVIAACVLGYGAGRILAHLIALEWNATGFDYTQAIPRRPVAGLLVLLYLSLSAGLVEEIVFRGLPALCLRPTVYPVVSAAAFAAIHWESGSRAVFAAFFLGVVLAALYLWLRNLWPFVAGHAVSDMLAFTGTYAY